MSVNVKRGMEFASQVSDKNDFNEDNPIFWATVKAIENVTESVNKLDEINGNILSQLFEITQWETNQGNEDHSRTQVLETGCR